MKKILTSILSLAMAATVATSASACTAIYVGGNHSETGNPMFARSEDISNSYNKVFDVIPAGVHKAGEEYTGCYGFTYTFTKDSYGYTAFMDDTTGECPDCGGTHVHTPYQAAGTNDQGVSMTATETLHGNEAVLAADPMNNETGIEEAEITTVILSESATAKEGIELLTKIYDETGCQGGSGIFIGDQKEIWYIENTTGHQYLAIKLNDDVSFIEPNMPVIGLVDLDDTENVIASADLIAVAQQAGTFVGDAEKNQINFAASYGEGTTNARMVEGFNYVTGASETAETLSIDDYAVTNVAGDAIVPFTSPVTPAKAFSVADVEGYFALPSIGHTSNLETHIFEIDADADMKISAVEWVSMDHDGFTLFVPYYPMMTTDVYEGYKVGTVPAAFTTEEPTEGFYYATTGWSQVDGQWAKVDGFKTLPEGWEAGYYWAFDALSNYCTFLNPDAAEGVKAALAEVQAEIHAEFATMKASVEDGSATEESLTAASAALAKMAHEAALSILKDAMAK